MRSILIFCFIYPSWGQEENTSEESKPILGAGTRSLCLKECQYQGQSCDGLKKKERGRCEMESQRNILTCQKKCDATFTDCHYEKSQCDYQCKFASGKRKGILKENCQHSCEIEFQCCNLNLGLDVLDPPLWATSRFCDLGCELDLDFCKDNCNGINQMPSSEFANHDCSKKCQMHDDRCQSTCIALSENGMCYNEVEHCQKTGGSNCEARGLCCMSNFSVPQNVPVPESTTSSPPEIKNLVKVITF